MLNAVLKSAPKVVPKVALHAAQKSVLKAAPNAVRRNVLKSAALRIKHAKKAWQEDFQSK